MLCSARLRAAKSIKKQRNATQQILFLFISLLILCNGVSGTSEQVIKSPQQQQRQHQHRNTLRRERANNVKQKKKTEKKENNAKKEQQLARTSYIAIAIATLRRVARSII